ncbi:MAG: hypothetical protein P8X63_14490, partial [Desulfuromonadaceae bacterium]
AILAGAKVAQVCSTLYLNGLEQIGCMKSQLESWMSEHGFEKLCDMRGRLRQQISKQPKHHERLQYIKYLTGLE